MRDEAVRLIDVFGAFIPVARPPPGARPIPTSWVFKTKPTRLKARLVATQSLKHFDVPDKFSPTISLATLRFMLAFAVVHNCTIATVDVAGAYLFAHLEPGEEIYLRTPSHFHDVVDFRDGDGNPAKFIKLTRYLYGVQRAGAAFYRHFCKWITGIGFRQCASDPCLFVCTKGTERLLVGCYVDDDVMVSTSEGLRLAFVRDQVRQLLVSLMHISGKYNPADIGTKALGPADFQRHARVVLGLSEIPTDAAGIRPL